MSVVQNTQADQELEDVIISSLVTAIFKLLGIVTAKELEFESVTTLGGILQAWPCPGTRGVSDLANDVAQLHLPLRLIVMIHRILLDLTINDIIYYW